MESVEYDNNGMPVEQDELSKATTGKDDTASRKQVFVNDLRFSQSPNRKNSKVKELPSQLIYDIPQTVFNQASKKNVSFNDVIETYILNSLSRKYAHDVTHAQLWLMFD